MKSKDEKSRKSKKDKNIKISLNKSNSFKNSWVQFVLIVLAIIVIAILGYIALAPFINKTSLEKDIINSKSTSSVSINKIAYYSSAFGTNNGQAQGSWNINLSQYTDIALYLNTNDLNISSMYIDNISFSNNEFSNLGVSYLSTDDFGKSPIETQDYSSITATIPERIDVNLSNPIVLRYLNYNLKENCSITDIDNPLIFDGSLLKRGKVTLSSLKNTISFTLHIVDISNQNHSCPVSINIPLENTETGKSIYDGYYYEY